MGYSNILSSDKILQIIGCGNALRLGSSEKVLHDWIGVISEGDFDWSLEAVDVPISRC